METVGYLGSVGAIAAIAIGSMSVVVGLLGKRIDVLHGDVTHLRQDMVGRFDQVDRRLTRLEDQNVTLIEQVARLAECMTDTDERVSRLEASASR